MHTLLANFWGKHSSMQEKGLGVCKPSGRGRRSLQGVIGEVCFPCCALVGGKPLKLLLQVHTSLGESWNLCCHAVRMHLQQSLRYRVPVLMSAKTLENLPPRGQKTALLFSPCRSQIEHSRAELGKGAKLAPAWRSAHALSAPRLRTLQRAFLPVKTYRSNLLCFFFDWSRIELDCISRR